MGDIPLARTSQGHAPRAQSPPLLANSFSFSSSSSSTSALFLSSPKSISSPPVSVSSPVSTLPPLALPHSRAASPKRLTVKRMNQSQRINQVDRKKDKEKERERERELSSSLHYGEKNRKHSPPTPVPTKGPLFSTPFTETLLSSVFSFDLPLLPLLFSTNNTDVFANAVFALLHDQPPPLLSFFLLHLLHHELNKTTDENTLFRGVSPAMKVMRVWVKTMCEEHLASILGPHVSVILAAPQRFVGSKILGGGGTAATPTPTPPPTTSSSTSSLPSSSSSSSSSTGGGELIMGNRAALTQTIFPTTTSVNERATSPNPTFPPNFPSVTPLQPSSSFSSPSYSSMSPPPSPCLCPSPPLGSNSSDPHLKLSPPISPPSSPPTTPSDSSTSLSSSSPLLSERESGTNNDDENTDSNLNSDNITKRSLNFLKNPSPTKPDPSSNHPRHSYSSATPFNPLFSFPSPSSPPVPRTSLSPHRAASFSRFPSPPPNSSPIPSPPPSPSSPCSPPPPLPASSPYLPPFHDPSQSPLPLRRRSSTQSPPCNSPPPAPPSLLLSPSLPPLAPPSSSKSPLPSLVNRTLSPCPLSPPSQTLSRNPSSPPLSPPSSPLLSPISTPLSPRSVMLPRCDWEKDKIHKNLIGTRRPPLLVDTFVERCSNRPWERRVQKICALITRELIANLSSFPSFPRHILGEMSELVKNFFPEKHLDSIGSVLILRVLCPLLCDPYTAGLCPTPPNATQRKALMNVMKLYQKICNSLPEKADDKYMYFETKKLRKYLSLLAKGGEGEEEVEEEEEEEEWKAREKAKGKGKKEEWERREKGGDIGSSTHRPLSHTRKRSLSQTRSLSSNSLSTTSLNAPNSSSSSSSTSPPNPPPSASPSRAPPSRASTRHNFSRPTSSYIPSRSPFHGARSPPRSSPPSSPPPPSLSSSKSNPAPPLPTFPSGSPLSSRSASSHSPRTSPPSFSTLSSTLLLLPPSPPPSPPSSPPPSPPPSPPKKTNSSSSPLLHSSAEELTTTKPNHEEEKPKSVESILAKPDSAKLHWRLDLQSKRDASEEIITSLRRSFPKFELSVKKELKEDVRGCQKVEDLLGGVKALLFPHEIVTLAPQELVLNVYECVDAQLVVTNQGFYVFSFPGGKEREGEKKGEYYVSWLKVLRTNFVFVEKESLESGVVIQYEEKKKKAQEGIGKVVDEAVVKEKGGEKWLICQLELVFREQRDAQFFCNLSLSMKQLGVLLEVGETRSKKIRDLEGSLVRTRKQVDEMRLRLDYHL